MSTAAITPADLALFAGIAASIFAISNGLLRLLVDYFSARFGGGETSRERTTRQEEQNAQCRFDHSNISQLMLTQNANIAELLKSNNRMLDALKDQAHIAELNHRSIMSEIRVLGREMQRDDG